jgi:2-oxoglutarate ferredoxin oxidoreductase subunit delta
MARNRGAVVINTEQCKGCQLCKEACPSKVLSMNEQANAMGYHYAYMENEEACTGCASCAYVCPDACITVYRVKN